MKLKKPEASKDEQTSVTFRLDVAQYERLCAAAEAADISVSEAIRQFIDHGLKGVKT